MLQSKTIRLVIVGLSAALLFFALNLLFLSLGGQPFVSSVVAYAIAFVFAYMAQHSWTFGGLQPHGRSFPRYLAVQVICALLSGLVAQIAARSGLAAALTSAMATVVGSAASFLLVRFWVFAPNAR